MTGISGQAREEAERQADAIFPETILAPENEQRAEDFIAGFLACAAWAASLTPEPSDNAERVIEYVEMVLRDSKYGRDVEWVQLNLRTDRLRTLAVNPEPSEGEVEAAARAYAGLLDGQAWPTNEELGGSVTSTRGDEYRDECVEVARTMLYAARTAREAGER